jgi:hypothetical protein
VIANPRTSDEGAPLSPITNLAPNTSPRRAAWRRAKRRPLSRPSWRRRRPRRPKSLSIHPCPTPVRPQPALLIWQRLWR